ncbi:MAG: isochorismatase family protein [Candidatus Omnitrophica bacterium]|nr:isochorismatase family protein [Candidatus Omnitrophota bacterium]
MAHSFVMSFDREIESFMAFAKTFPGRAILLVDTYDTKKGIESALKVAKNLKKEGYDLLGIRLDSGDIAQNAKYARNLLDEEGLIDASIFATGNLDEYKIEKLLETKAPIDAFGVGTHMGCSSDVPFTDVIYKLVEIKEGDREFIPTMKLSRDKTTLPCKKQLLRISGKNNIMERDMIVLEDEKSKGKKLLTKIMEGGKRICREKSIEEKRKSLAQKIKTLPEALKGTAVTFTYPVVISKKLTKTTEHLKLQIKKHILPRVIFFDIDTQYDFIHPKGSLYVKESQKIIANAKKLTRHARDNGILIVSSLDTHVPEDPEFKQFPRHCVSDTKGHKKVKGTFLNKTKFLDAQKTYSIRELKDIARMYPQIILPKNVFNVFSNPNALNLFETQCPDHVYVYGVTVDYCVKEAVEGLIKAGLTVSVVEDAVREISQEEKESLFSLWKKKGVTFITTDVLLETLSQLKESAPV